MPRLLVIDNYDSFTYNLVQMFMQYDLDLEVYRHDEISVCDVETNLPDYILISPGPRDPRHSGVSIDFIKSFYFRIPILGICLGMQCINEFFGGQTISAPVPIHGKTSDIYHNSNGLFKGLPSPFRAARYHSLIAVPPDTIQRYDSPLVINAWSSDDVIMSFSHVRFPLHGLQFHPESFLTNYGFAMVENFLKLGSMKNQL